VETPVNITEGFDCYLGSHVGIMVFVLVYVRSKWSRVHTLVAG